MDDRDYEQFRTKFETFAKQHDVKKIGIVREELYSKFERLFSEARIDDLTAEDYEGFMADLNDKGDFGIQYSKSKEDFNNTKEHLKYFMYCRKDDLSIRVNQVLRSGKEKKYNRRIKGMQRSPSIFLHMSAPHSYIIWNDAVQDVFIENRLITDHTRKTPFEMYEQNHRYQNELKRDLNLDFFTLDHLLRLYAKN